jgi:hypothetical protein
VLEDLHIAGVVVVANNTLERLVAHALALGSASTKYKLLTVPVLRVEKVDVLFVL